MPEHGIDFGWMDEMMKAMLSSCDTGTRLRSSSGPKDPYGEDDVIHAQLPPPLPADLRRYFKREKERQT